MPSPKKKAANKKPTPPLSSKTPTTAEMLKKLKEQDAQMKDVLKEMDNVAAEPSKLDPTMVAKAVEAAKALDGQPYAHGDLVVANGGGGGGGNGISYNDTITTSGTWSHSAGNYTFTYPSAYPSPELPKPPSALIYDITTWMQEQWPHYTHQELLDGNNKAKHQWADYDTAVKTLQKRIDSYVGSTWETKAGSKYQAIMDKLVASKHNPHAGVANGQNVQFGEFQIGQASQAQVKHDVAQWLAFKWPSFTVEGVMKTMSDEYDTYEGAVKAIKECMKYSGHEEQKKYQWVLQQLQHSHHNTTGWADVVDSTNLSSPPPATPKPYDIVAIIESYWPPKDSAHVHQVNLNTWGTYSHDKIVKQLQYRIGISSGHNKVKWQAILETVQSVPAEAGQSMKMDIAQWITQEWAHCNVKELIGTFLNIPAYDTFDGAVADLQKRAGAAKSPSEQKYYKVLAKLVTSKHAVHSHVGYSFTGTLQPGIHSAANAQPAEVVEFVPYDGTAGGARTTALSIVNGDCNLTLPLAFDTSMSIYHQHVFLDACRTVIGEGMKRPSQHIHQMKRAQKLLDAAKALNVSLSA